MTQEEAIKTIEIAKAEVEWNYPMEYQEAFDVAVECIEKQSQIVHCKECQYWTTARLEGFGRTGKAPACSLVGWFCGDEGYCMYGRKVE